MRKILKNLYILQVVSNKDRETQGLRRLGHGHNESSRFNPYNPLSYIAFIIILIVGIFILGPVGNLKEFKSIHPFKWN